MSPTASYATCYPSEIVGRAVQRRYSDLGSSKFPFGFSHANQRLIFGPRGNRHREAVTLSIAGYSTSIAGVGNLSIRHTAAMCAGNAAAAIQNEFQRAKKLEPASNLDRNGKESILASGICLCSQRA